MEIKNMNKSLTLVLGLALALPSSAGSQTRRSDRCIASSNPNHLIVFQDVATLNQLRTIPLRGVFATSEGVVPIDGSAVLERDGSVRLGLFVHAGSMYPNSWMMSGYTDGNFAGVFGFDFNGDNQAEIHAVFQAVDCSTVQLPY
jgi:hypothetical protein